MRDYDWRTDACEACPLSEKRTKIVISSPPPFSGILAIGEAPGADEDRIGEGFVGTAGKTLDRLFLSCGVKRDEYGRANVCRCRPPENRKPSSSEISACILYLSDLIAEFRPKVILTVGATPTTLFFGKNSLSSIIASRSSPNDWKGCLLDGVAVPSLFSALPPDGFVVATPHTSPLAFNRNAPSGEKWAVIAERQVRLCVSILRDELD